MNPQAIRLCLFLVNKSENNDFWIQHEKALFLSCRTPDTLDYDGVSYYLWTFGRANKYLRLIKRTKKLFVWK